MEKNQPFFDPYNFNMQPMQNQMPNIGDMPPAEMVNPTMYYEQQYTYYRYLSQMLDYKMKLKEWERSNSEKN